MSSNTIFSAMPSVIARGIQDLSKRTVTAALEEIPTHLPKVYIYAQKGKSTPLLVAGNSRELTYGTDSFDERKPWANHATVLSNLLSVEGNAQMIERVIPSDAGPKSNLILWMEVAEGTTVTQYQRDSDTGAYILDTFGQPIEVTTGPTTLAGNKIRFLVTHSTTDTTLGALSQSAGTMTGLNGVTVVPSVRYPILELQATAQGEYYNNTGIRLWAPDANDEDRIDTAILASNKIYPYRIGMMRRTDASSTAKMVMTQSSDAYINFSFKANQINPVTDANFSLTDVFLGAYQNLTNPTLPITYGDFGTMAVYYSSIDSILTTLYASEYAHNTGGDFTGAAGEKHLFNFISGKSSDAIPYYTLEIDTVTTGSLSLTKNISLFAAGGSDGTMNDAAFGTSVAALVADYADPNSYLQDNVTYCESHLYDSGYPLATKQAMINFIAERKDTIVVLSTYDTINGQMTVSEEHSVAASLRTRLRNYPESTYFGTSVCRGFLVSRNGVLRDHQYNGRLPLTLDWAVKSAKFMGAGSGLWRDGFVPDSAPNNEITIFDDISNTFTPVTNRLSDWAIGLNWPQTYQRGSAFWPAMKSVYDDDTSVLNSYFTVCAAVECQKIGARVHRDFTGTISLTDAQLIERVNTKVNNYVSGKFAGLFVIKPNAYISESDTQRGYSWSLQIKLYANNMRTVETFDVQLYRMSDLATV